MRCLAFAATLALASAAAAESAVDVHHYDLDVEVASDRIVVKVVVEGEAKKLPAKWSLELARTMRVRSASVPHTADGDALVLDLSGRESPLRIEIEVEGAPYNRFSPDRGGFVRTAITPEIAYVRSQYPWYPRAPDDPATYRTRVRAPEGWHVRTAGRQEEPGLFVCDVPSRRVGLVAAPYQRLASGGPVDALVPPGDSPHAQALIDATQGALDHYRARFGPVANPGLTIVQMPVAYGTASGYGEDGYILVGPEPFETGRGLELLVHEAAHKWWGHEVDFSDFASEMLATYATLVCVEEARGEEAALSERRKSVQSLLEAADAGKEVALRDIEGFGGGLDPQTYRTHAYDKAMMLLVMLEDTLGRERTTALLRGFLEEHRGALVGYRELRAHLAKKGGSAARRLIDAWEKPGIPTLEVSFRKGKGTLEQKGGVRPFPMGVVVRGCKGDRACDTVVKLNGRKATFRFKDLPDPETIVVDPGFRLPVRRESPGASPEECERASEIARGPNEADPAKLEEAIGILRRALAAGNVDDATYRGFLGRCLFRAGKLDEAGKELAKAVETGLSPFHRQWAHLRLGCIADLAKRRKEAVEHYEKAVAIKPDAFSAKKATRFLETPYRGYQKDG